MPRVDALGVSSAGIYINNEAKVGSLFIQVPEELFEEHVKNIYIDIAKELNVPLVVANDGDVTALAGAMALKKNNLLGIAMGTSEAVGYINNDGNISGWLNELAFVPVDVQKTDQLMSGAEISVLVVSISHKMQLLDLQKHAVLSLRKI